MAGYLTFPTAYNITHQNAALSDITVRKKKAKINLKVMILIYTEILMERPVGFMMLLFVFYFRVVPLYFFFLSTYRAPFFVFCILIYCL